LNHSQASSSAVIVGLGTWLPETVRANGAWAPGFSERVAARTDRTFNDIPACDDPDTAAIVARDLEAEKNDPFLGVRERRIADESTTTVEVDVAAALAALRDAGLEPGSVDLVVSYAAVPDRITPPSATAVAHRIGATRAVAFGIDAACASIVTQLDVARAYIGAGMARTVLLVQSHLMMRITEMEHPASPGLGDAASAVVVAGSGRGLRIRSTFSATHGDQAPAVTWIRGNDDATDVPWWKPGGDFRLGSRAPERVKTLMRDTVTYGADTIREAARVGGVPVADLNAIVSVQPRGFIPHAIAERLGLPRACAVTTYEDIAHVGACGPVFNLLRARALGRTPAGARIAMYAQGAGFTRAAAILEAS
jgi:3-oxoacyl-[acyl-carrier-protein] synthase-3